MNFQALANEPLRFDTFQWHYVLRDEVALADGRLKVTGAFTFEVYVPKYDVNRISAIITEIVPEQYHTVVIPLQPRRKT